MICIGDEIRLYRDTLDIKQIVDSQIMYSKSNNKRNTGAEIYDILKNDKKKERTSFLVACTRLYKSPCRSVRPSVRHTLLFLHF